MAVPQSLCRISRGKDSTLTAFNDNAVVSLTNDQLWEVKMTRDPDGRNPNYTLTMQKDEGGPERALTLDLETKNVLVQSLEHPPSKNQLWTLEDAIVTPRHPPIIHCRIQSAADPNVSANLGGSVPLPRIFMNVAGVPNEEAQSDRWVIDCREML